MKIGILIKQPIPVAAPSKASVCGRSLAGIAGSNPAGGGEHGYLSLVSVVCCQLEVFVTGRFLIQRSPTKCVCVCACVFMCACLCVCVCVCHWV